VSWATITVTGACLALSTLPAISEGSSRALASGARRNTNRPGKQFMLVGPHFSRS